MVTSGPDNIPNGEVAIIAGEKSVESIEGMDNLLLDDSGRARLRAGGVLCDLKARGAVGFHVYVPEAGNFFCVEPVSHRPNAFSGDAEQHTIEPGETRRLSMQLTVMP
jgi:aldose 1-epimerase